MSDDQNTGDGTANPPTTDPATDSGKAPKFEGEFDADRAAKLVANLRAELDEAKGKLKTHEDAGKSELEKLLARAEKAEQLAADTAHALAVKAAAEAAKLPADLHEFLTGKTPAELESQAKKLAERFGVAGDGTPPPGTRPKAKLVPGQGSGDNGDTFDADAIAKAARRR